MVPVRSGLACLVALFLSACGDKGNSGDKLPLLPPDSSFAYTSPPAFTVTIPISPVVPTHAVYLTRFSIIPNLPAGLVLDPTTGVISGTPTQVSAATKYTVSVPDGTSTVTATLVISVNPLPTGVIPGTPTAVSPRHTYRLTATNAAGADTFDLDIEANSPLGIDLGIAAMDRTCDPAGPCTVEGALAGTTVVIREQTGWNTYSSVDGALIAHLDVAPDFASAWTLANDGSYLLFAGTDGVQAITPQGLMLFMRAGNYLTAAQGSSYFAGWFPDLSKTQPLDAQFSGLGAVTGDYVWFVSGSTLRVEAR